MLCECIQLGASSSVSLIPWGACEPQGAQNCWTTLSSPIKDKGLRYFIFKERWHFLSPGRQHTNRSHVRKRVYQGFSHSINSSLHIGGNWSFLKASPSHSGHGLGTVACSSGITVPGAQHRGGISSAHTHAQAGTWSKSRPECGLAAYYTGCPLPRLA